MTDVHETSDARSVLTPMAAAIAGFTLGAVSLFGNGALGVAVQALLTGSDMSGSYHTIVTWTGAAQALLAFIGLALAQRVLATTRPADPARHLAGAALVVGGIGLLVGLLTILGGALD